MRLARVLVLLTVAALAGCGLFSKKDKAKPAANAPLELRILAGADANPDSEGRASPVVVRIYVLENSGEFLGANFEALYGNDKAALSAGWKFREEMLLAPGTEKTLKIEAPGATHELCALVAFRAVRASQWRACAPAAGARAIRIDSSTVAIDSGG